MFRDLDECNGTRIAPESRHHQSEPQHSGATVNNHSDHPITEDEPFPAQAFGIPLPFDLRRKQLWQAEILGPVLVVASLWIVMSVGTTIYLRWVESEYDRVFSENLSSIRIANQLEATVWRTVAGWTDPAVNADELALRREDNEKRLLGFLAEISPTASTHEEQTAQRQLQKAVSDICSAMNVEVSISRTTGERGLEALQRLWMQAADVAAHCATVRRINERLITVARDRLAGTQSTVMLIRMLMLLLGPMVGVLLGWRVARRLRTSMSEIAVTLRDSAATGESPEMTVSITRESPFEDVRRQAERVVERLRVVGQELQSARREVIQSERLAAVGELAAGVAHELRNPLTSVKLLLQHAARQPDSFRLSESQLQLILQEVGRMETTIQGLLDFSRRPALKRVRHDLRETLHRSLNLVDGRLRQTGIELSTSISPMALWVDGDAEQLNQVFVNLLLNSIEALGVGGQVHVAAGQWAPGTVTVTVADTGGGIAAEILPRLFEPFATTREQGTGLGLAISHRIVTEHQGTIQVSNRPGDGATFAVNLPLHPD